MTRNMRNLFQINGDLMKIKVLNSGSEGNGYVIETGSEILLIECGVPAKEMLKCIGFNTSKVAGCVCSHSHEDHSKYISSYAKYGFPILMTEESRPANCRKVTTIPRMKTSRVGTFNVVPFRVPHNETECDGFYITHPEFGKLLFITDAEMCPYNMSGLGINHLLIECNYSLDYVEMTDSNKNHVLLGHMELQTCKRFIQTVYSEDLKSIGLIHLSKRNGDPDEFRREIEASFPSSITWIATKHSSLEV